MSPSAALKLQHGFYFQTKGTYQWTDRWRLVYSKWSSGEPKQALACVYLDTDGTWKTASCREKFFSVCKKSDGKHVLTTGCGDLSTVLI